MNILFLAKLTENPWAGTNNCIPEQIYAQSKIDNVMWLNLNHKKLENWKKDTYVFHNLDSVKPRLAQLPAPFNHPDLVVVQQSYNNPFSKIIRDIQKAKIPYVIQPHGEYNIEAQKRHRIKKIIGNILYFNRMIKKSAAIEFLTENEQKNSICPQKKFLIIPNGIDVPDYHKVVDSLTSIKATFIGRLSIYHKGLDVLLEAITMVKSELEKANFQLKIYGPDECGSKEQLNNFIKEKELQRIVSIHDGVCGQEKKDVLQETDLFVLTSRFEGHPIALLEALSYGVPCLVTPGTNMDKEVSRRDAGWCSEFSAEAISNEIVKIIESKNEWQKKSDNARALASVYSWNSIAEKAHGEYIKLLEEIALFPVKS